MERAAYREMADLDQRHWWYRGRRAILAELIRREAMPPKDGRILEIGCGTGHNLEMLGRFGRVEAIELDDESKPAVLRAYLKEWAWEVGAFFEGVGADATDEQLATIAPKHPIFRISAG